MKVLLIQVLLLLFPVSRTMQEEPIYTVSEVSVKPDPEKGMKNFQDRWMRKVEYPKEAIRKNTQGVVFIEFIVNKDGTITDAQIRSGIGNGCDEAALKGFNEIATEPWTPAIRLGKQVKVRMVLPFYFRIINQP